MTWEEYCDKYDKLLLDGAQKGLVLGYGDELLSNLREYYYGGMSVSLLLLFRKIVNGRCYDIAPLVTLGFGDDDFNVVYADINGIRLNPVNVEMVENGMLDEKTYADHCYVERYSDGKTWIYDTTAGFIFEKSIYDELEDPKERLRRSKKETIEYLDSLVSKELDVGDVLLSQYSLGLFEKKSEPVQFLYEEELKREIELMKKKYDKAKQKIKV